jgi:predicted nucleotidyltransferase
MSLDELRRTRRHEILDVAKTFGARNVRVFGSVARGKDTAASDIDLLVDLDPDRTLMDLGGLLMELQTLLGRPVDVTTEAMLRPHVREQALRDAIPL